jgi:hypothetical protein
LLAVPAFFLHSHLLITPNHLTIRPY